MTEGAQLFLLRTLFVYRFRVVLMAAYFLHTDVYFCHRGDSAVFLDLRNDDYILATAEVASALRALSPHPQSAALTEKQANAIAELVNGGLLTTQQNAGKRIAPTAVGRPMTRLVDQEDLPDIRIRATHIRQFIVACSTAAFRLRWYRLERTVRTVEQRKLRNLSSVEMSIDRARELTGTFLILRSYFPADFLCLYDSLALIEYLAAYGVFPTWVFGIKLEPWAAHCWVQENQFTLNEDFEEAAGYTPILAI